MKFIFGVVLTIAEMAYTNVLHTECGIYTLATAHEPAQHVVNSLTGEHVVVQRTAEMVSACKYYHVDYSDAGWAYLTFKDCKKKLWLKLLGFTKVAVRSTVPDDKGRVAVQNSATQDVVWLDEGHAKTTRTMEVKQGWKLDMTHYDFERGFIDTMKVIPHPRGGTHLWDVRCVHGCIVDTEDALTAYATDDWVSKNFFRACDSWSKQLGHHQASHWFQSEKSWKTRAKASPLLIETCLGTNSLLMLVSIFNLRHTH